MKMLISILLIPAAAIAQSIPSLSLSRADAPIVIADYLGYVPRPHQVAIWETSPTSSVVSTWNVTNAIPNWSGLMSATNVAVAKARIKAEKSKFTGNASAFSVEERAIGMAMIDLVNGRISNLVVEINKTVTNKITAAEIGGFITPQEAAGVAEGYLP